MGSRVDKDETARMRAVMHEYNHLNILMAGAIAALAIVLMAMVGFF